MPASTTTPVDLSSHLRAEEPIEAVLLLTRTGSLLGAWTRASAPLEVLSVMAATFLGSIETMLLALGGKSPEEVSAVVDRRRLLTVKINPQVVLLLVAGEDFPEKRLRTALARIVQSLPPLSAESHGASI